MYITWWYLCRQKRLDRWVNTAVIGIYRNSRIFLMVMLPLQLFICQILRIVSVLSYSKMLLEFVHGSTENIWTYVTMMPISSICVYGLWLIWNYVEQNEPALYPKWRRPSEVRDELHPSIPLWYGNVAGGKLSNGLSPVTQETGWKLCGR